MGFKLWQVSIPQAVGTIAIRGIGFTCLFKFAKVSIPQAVGTIAIVLVCLPINLVADLAFQYRKR